LVDSIYLTLIVNIGLLLEKLSTLKGTNKIISGIIAVASLYKIFISDSLRSTYGIEIKKERYNKSTSKDVYLYALYL
tara:strand:+ start:3478 stop:3708 length:231 start_codon:yes stop_codon:yes gene_type:complete